MNKKDLMRKAWVKCAVRLPNPKDGKIMIYIPEGKNVVTTNAEIFHAQQSQLKDFPDLAKKVRGEPYWSSSGYLATHWMPECFPED